MTFEIIPYVGTGPLKFDMERAEVQALLAEEGGIPFTPGGKEVCDYYHALGILVAYDDKLRCSYIALSKPISAIYKGKDLLCLNSEQISKLLNDDANLEKHDDGLTSRLHGIGTVFEYKTKPVASVTAFKKGLYDKNDEKQRKLETLDLSKMSVDDIFNFIENG